MSYAWLPPIFFLDFNRTCAECAKLLFFNVKYMLPLLSWLLTVSSLFFHPVGGATASNTWWEGTSLTVDVCGEINRYKFLMYRKETGTYVKFFIV